MIIIKKNHYDKLETYKSMHKLRIKKAEKKKKALH